MNIHQYFQRINYSGPVLPKLSVLQHLQKNHLLHIPFENLDIHQPRKIELDVDQIYQKIIEEYRGGFCYELNGLFYALLREIGFVVKMISGRVYSQQKGYGPEYDHLALIVRLEEQDYLVDVGFGEFVFHPLKLELKYKQEDERGIFLIDQFDETYLRVNKVVEEVLVPQYLFTLQARAYQEFAGMSHFHQTSSDSHFSKHPFLGIPIPDGRITLVGHRLKILKNGKIEEREIDEAMYNKLLIKHFHFK